jgi:predicted NBD/HSP70 family sugar kinase
MGNLMDKESQSLADEKGQSLADKQGQSLADEQGQSLMDKQGFSKDLKLQILNIIRNNVSATKLGLAKNLNVNLTTISKLVNELYFSDKVIAYSGEDLSTGGRKPKLYILNKSIGHVIGVDVGGYNIRVVITDIAGDVIGQLKEKNNFSSDGALLIERVAALISQVKNSVDIDDSALFGIGMSISGVIDYNEGKSIYCPNIGGLNDFPVKSFMETKMGLPIFVDDSVRCMAIAEKHFGAAKDYDNFLFVSLGKGIGVGIYIDGKVYRSSTGLAGELGHITVAEDGPLCNCGNRGCLEAIASGPGIIRRAREGIESGIITSLTSFSAGDFERLTVEMIAEAAKQGDKFAYHIINRTGEYIGIAIAAALNLFGSELVVLGGGIAGSGDIMTEAIKRTVQLRALGVISSRVKTVESSLDEFVAARGAATKFINMLFTDSKYNLLKNRVKV